MASHSGEMDGFTLIERKPPQNKISLKRKLQAHLKTRFSTVQQEFGDYIVQDTELYILDRGMRDQWTQKGSEHEVAATDTRQIGSKSKTDKEHVKLQDVFAANSSMKVLTLGAAGAGKTVAVQKFVMDWAEEKSNQDIDFIFVLTFRELNLMDKKHFELPDLLLSFYPDLKELRNFDNFHECKTLYVFDGLNENRLKLDFMYDDDDYIYWPDGKTPIGFLITDIIRYSSPHIWITSRQAAASLIPRKHLNLVTEMRGFNYHQRNQFFQKIIKNPEKARKVIDLAHNNRSLRIMCHIPLFCWIVSVVLEDMLDNKSKEKPPRTVTEVFLSFCVLQIRQMDEKYQKHMSLREKGALLVKLGKLAFKHLDKGTLIFCDYDLMNSGAVEAGFCAPFYKDDSTFVSVKRRSTFSFVHLSVQEFLGALYVLQKGVHWANPLFKSWKGKLSWLSSSSRSDLYKVAVEKALQSQNGHLDLFVRFLLGLAPMLEPVVQSPLNVWLPQVAPRDGCIATTVHCIKKTIVQDESAEKTIRLFHCLNELGDNSLDEEFNRYMSSGNKVATLTPTECSELAYLLTMSSEVLEEFDLKKYLRSEQGLNRMLSVVEISRKVWLNWCCLSSASCKLLKYVLQSKDSYVRELDMSNNNLQDEGVEVLCVGLKDPQCKLEKLWLNHCLLTKSSCKLLASVLDSTLSHLREMDMSGNDLQDEGVKLFCEELRNPQCKLETLRLNHCQLSKESCDQLLSVLQRTPSYFRELDMSGNDLRDEGVELLCERLSDPQCKLETLRLSGCLITHKGCSVLASTLKSNPSHLRELDLSYNHPGDTGVRELTARMNDPKCKLEMCRFDHGGECRNNPGPRKYACELTLDPDTAYRHLSLSEGNRKVTHVREEQPYPDQPERFDSLSQILCREGLSGRCYWETEWRGDGCDIAVAYKSIQRSSHSSGFGYNDKSWCLHIYGNRYSVYHNNTKTDIPASSSSSSSRVGVYLDWPAGTLSFYSVSSDILTHLHTFYSKFTEPLYPGFGVGDKDVSLSLCQIT